MFTNDVLITERCFMSVKEIIKFSLCLTAFGNARGYSRLDDHSGLGGLEGLLIQDSLPILQISSQLFCI